MKQMSICIAKAVPADAPALIQYMRQIGKETDNLTFGAEGLPFSVEAEADYIAQLETSADGVMLVAKENGQIIGNASLNRLPRRMNHRGELGISVAKSHWNRGVGSSLMRCIIDYANANDFAIIDLQVRSDNASAIHLYEKFGFRKLCTYPAFFRIGDQYIDFDYMCLRLM